MGRTTQDPDPIGRLAAQIAETDSLDDARHLAIEIYMTGRIAQYRESESLVKQIRDGLKSLNPTAKDPPPPVS